MELETLIFCVTEVIKGLEALRRGIESGVEPTDLRTLDIDEKVAFINMIKARLYDVESLEHILKSHLK